MGAAERRDSALLHRCAHHPCQCASGGLAWWRRSLYMRWMDGSPHSAIHAVGGVSASIPPPRRRTELFLSFPMNPWSNPLETDGLDNYGTQSLATQTLLPETDQTVRSPGSSGSRRNVARDVAGRFTWCATFHRASGAPLGNATTHKYSRDRGWTSRLRFGVSGGATELLSRV